MPDPIFADPRLAPFYDAFDGPRDDLDLYVDILCDLAARSVLDVGGGTGCLALRLAELSLDVVVIDPAEASLDVARNKSAAQQVRWVHGTTADLAGVSVDAACMTGNVAQVFLDDGEWTAVLSDINRCLRPGGHLVFETRRPEARAWEGWSEAPLQARIMSAEGPVTRTFRVTAVERPFVSFEYDYLLPDGTRVVSTSMLRFRSLQEIEDSLTATGFTVMDVRDAPDRPGLEYVFIARKANEPAG